MSLDASLAASLAAGMPALPDGMPSSRVSGSGAGSMLEGAGDWSEEYKLRRRANDAVRDVQQFGQIPLVAGAGTLQDFNRFGVPQGYFMAVYRLTAQGFTAGTVTAYRDSTAGEPLLPFTVAAVNILSKTSTILHPMSQIVWGATSITGVVNVWMDGVLFESWLWPWVFGANR